MSMQDTVQKVLDAATADVSQPTGVPGAVMYIADKTGKEIAWASAGVKQAGKSAPMTKDSVFWIASCTKMIATIAVMQLVEQGKLDLDDHKQLYKLCPELEKVKVLTDDGKLEDKEAEITLRMLLSHVSVLSSVSMPNLTIFPDRRLRLRVLQPQT